MLKGMFVQNVVNCPTVCPSCQVNSALSKLDTVMGRFPTDDLPPHPKDFRKEDQKFSGSDAHSIVSQALLRDHVRTTLTAFLDRHEKVLGSRSPCVFQDKQVWADFEKTYIAGLVQEASRQADEEAIAQWLASKDRGKLREKAGLDQTFTRLREWQAVWDGDGKTAPEKGDAAPVRQANTKPAATFQPPELENDLSSAQRDSLDKFISRDLKEDAISFTVERSGDQNIRFRMTRPLRTSDGGIRDDATVERRKVCDAKGKTITYEEQETVSDKLQATQNLIGAKQQLAKDEWVGGMFSSIMGKPFTKGTQCRYCEVLQRDESVIQRHRYWKSHEGIPDEYVGKGLIEEIESRSGGDAQAYVAGWMQGVAAELRERILQACEDAGKVASASSSSSSSALVSKGAEGGNASLAKSHSAEAMDKAIEDAFEEVRKEKKPFTENKLMGVARAQLATDKAKVIDSRALTQRVQESLGAMVEKGALVENATKKQYSFPKS